MHFLLPFITVLCLFITTSSKQLIPQQPKSILLEQGQIYQQILPQFFQLYQAPQLTAFNPLNSAQNSTPNSTPRCTIVQIKPSQFITNSIMYHYKLADPEKYFLGHKKIANFSTLPKLQGIIDSTSFHSRIVTLFQNGFFTITTIDSQSNITKNQIKLLYDQSQNIQQNTLGKQLFKTALNYGNLLHSKTNPNHLLFIGEDKALIMNQNQQIFQDLSGYQVLGIDFENSILVGNQIFVAMGFNGIHLFQVDFIKKTIQLQKKYSLQITYDKVHVPLEISDLAWDPVSKQLIVIDLDQGVHWVKPSQKTSDSTQMTITFSLYIENCKNLQIDDQEKVAIATCPELLIVNLTDKTHQIIDGIEFDAETLLINESRVLVFGEYRYAIYDLDTDLIETGQSETKLDFVTIIQNWIVAVNTLSISIGEIHPDQQKIMCFADPSNPNILGIYSANLTIEGICSELYSMPMLCKTNETSIFFPSEEEMHMLMHSQKTQENCLISYTINLEVRNSSQVSYFWEIVAGAIILWILCSGMIIYCVKDVKVKKEYEELKEEVNTTRAKAESTDSQLFGEK